MSPELEDLTYYHGSPEWLNDGEYLVPGCVCGKGEGMEDVYVTTELSIAHGYAGYDGFIYMVRPDDDISEDICTDDGKPITFICSKAKILTCVY